MCSIKQKCVILHVRDANVVAILVAADAMIILCTCVKETGRFRCPKTSRANHPCLQFFYCAGAIKAHIRVTQKWRLRHNGWFGFMAY